MNLNLTNEEAVVLKHLLEEELYTVEDMSSTAEGSDKKELEHQVSIMKSIIVKIQ